MGVPLTRVRSILEGKADEPGGGGDAARGDRRRLVERTPASRSTGAPSRSTPTARRSSREPSGYGAVSAGYDRYLAAGYPIATAPGHRRVSRWCVPVSAASGGAPASPPFPRLSGSRRRPRRRVTPVLRFHRTARRRRAARTDSRTLRAGHRPTAGWLRRLSRHEANGASQPSWRLGWSRGPVLKLRALRASAYATSGATSYWDFHARGPVRAEQRPATRRYGAMATVAGLSKDPASRSTGAPTTC